MLDVTDSAGLVDLDFEVEVGTRLLELLLSFDVDASVDAITLCESCDDDETLLTDEGTLAEYIAFVGAEVAAAALRTGIVVDTAGGGTSLSLAEAMPVLIEPDKEEIGVDGAAGIFSALGDGVMDGKVDCTAAALLTVLAAANSLATCVVSFTL